MNDRDRTSPEALTAQQPVAQTVGDRRLADALVPEELAHLLDGLSLGGDAIEESGVLVCAVTGGGDAGLARIGLAGVDDRDDVDAVLAGEVEVTLIVGRHGHDGTGAVVSQHIVASPHWNLGPVDGIGRLDTERHTGLLVLGGLTLDLGLLLDLTKVGLEVGTGFVGDDLLGQGGVGSDDHEGRSIEGVGASGEDPHRLLTTVDGEVDVGPLGSTTG